MAHWLPFFTAVRSDVLSKEPKERGQKGRLGEPESGRKVSADYRQHLPKLISCQPTAPQRKLSTGVDPDLWKADLEISFSRADPYRGPNPNVPSQGPNSGEAMPQQDLSGILPEGKCLKGAMGCYFPSLGEIRRHLRPLIISGRKLYISQCQGFLSTQGAWVRSPRLKEGKGSNSFSCPDWERRKEPQVNQWRPLKASRKRSCRAHCKVQNAQK